MIVYGTAWKEDATERLTRLALDNGFRGIDTANQRKHYFEAAVGKAVQSFLSASGVKRESNVSLEQLELLCGMAKVRPAIVQNRCHASRGWDRDVRAFCTQHGIAYQSFSLLTANPNVVNGATVRAIEAFA